jgi:YqaJ-like viral recombinase domain
MTIIVTPVENNAQWHGLRANVVGASEAGALLGVHDYLSYYGLWARKSGRLPPQQDNPAMERGRRLEPVAIDLMRDRYPYWDVTVPHAHYADPEFGLGATPDVLATDCDRGPGVIQIKSVAPSVFHKTWRGETDAVTPPLWIAIQALLEAHLTGAKWAQVGCLVVDHEIDLFMIEVPMHQAIIETIKIEALQFWRLVGSGREPDPDYARDSELIRAMLQRDDGSEIDLSGDNELGDLLDQRETALALVKQYEAEARVVNARLLHKLGEAAIGRFAGGYISAKTVNRAAHEVKASSYRQLRVVRDRR